MFVVKSANKHRVLCDSIIKMERFSEQKFNAVDKSKKPEAKPRYFEASRRRETQILEQFSPEEQEEILEKRKTLSSLAYFIGKDFYIPVELNAPGAGWHWDFEHNVIRIDPKDLLEKPMDYLRFVISHEGGHRRISRTEFIPKEEWRQPGFSFMMNAIEDPRDNNFVEENYPRFREQMEVAYDSQFMGQDEAVEEAKKKVGYTPRFMQAGFEYIRRWYAEKTGKEVPVDEDLPPEVIEVVSKTLDSARESWWTYPSREEADSSEERISRYAQTSYEINRDRVWPEFKRLVDMDMEDQKVQEMLQDMKSGQQKGEESEGSGGSGHGLPQELQDKLTDEQKQELEDAIKESLDRDRQKKEDAEAQKSQGGEPSGEEQTEGSQEEAGSDTAEQGKPSEKGSPISLDSLSDELVDAIKKHIDSLPDEERKELEKKAKEAMKEIQEMANEEVEGKLSSTPDRQVEDSEQKEAKTESVPRYSSEVELDEETLKKFRERTQRVLESDESEFERQRREVLPIIDQLERDLREVFLARRAKGWESGHRTGKRIDIKHRIQEKAKGISAVQSKAWQKREIPLEKDYAITLLNDLSGSMQGEKIREDFKAKIVLSEVLNRLSIKNEILGFNDRIYEYKPFDEPMSKEVRSKMGGMLREVSDSSDTGKARWNDDGWALEQASMRLAREKANEKFLIVLSDGLPEESPLHPRSRYELGKMVERVMKETDQKLIGVGIGSGTRHVEGYYPHSMADVTVEDMAERLADLIREVIVNYNKF